MYIEFGPQKVPSELLMTPKNCKIGKQDNIFVSEKKAGKKRKAWERICWPGPMEQVVLETRQEGVFWDNIKAAGSTGPREPSL